MCATRAPTSADDCETNPPNPGGFYCCITLDDSGSPSSGFDASGPDGTSPPTALDAGLGPAGSYASLTCAQRTTDADDAVFAASNQAEGEPSDTSCATDSDCVVAGNSSICWNGCGVVLNKAGAAQLQSVVGQINATICATFVADGCKPNPPPPCAPLLPSCVKGTCSDFPGPTSEDAGSGAD
jgi:hypothetical protein